MSQMSITNFADQKAIMTAVKEGLADLKKPKGGRLDDMLAVAEVEEGEGRETGAAEPKKRTQRRSAGRKSFERRPSFDYKKQFEKIDAMRGELDGEVRARAKGGWSKGRLKRRDS